MPIQNGSYVSPTWHDNGPPSMDAAEMQAISDTTEQTQNDKADIDSPALTGTPTVPNPTDGDNSKQIATTAFVRASAAIAFPTDTASGPIASFPDGADGVVVKSMTIAIDPVQDLHGYDSPWPAGGGKNKWEFGDVNVTTAYQPFVLSTPLPAGTYTVSASIVGTYAQAEMRFRDEDGGAITGVSLTANGTRYNKQVTLSQPAYRIYLYSAQGQSGYTADWKDIQIEAGSTATSWTPYSNLCPISGWTGATVPWTGRNIIFPKYAGRTNAGITYTVNADGTITTSGTATATSWAAPNLTGQPQLMTLLPPGTYTVTGGISANERVYLGGIYTDGTAIPTASDTGSGATYVFTKPAYVYPQIQIANGTTSNRTFTIQLEVGSTAHAYSPYISRTFALTWQDAAGTVYGGTAEYIGGGQWQVTPTMAIETYTDATGFASHSSNRWYHNGLPSGADYSHRTEAISNEARYNDASNTYGAYFAFGSAGVYVNKLTADETIEAFSTRLSTTPLQICYVLATPVSFIIDGPDPVTLYGPNNVWADTGDVSLQYRADTGLYIAKIINS